MWIHAETSQTSGTLQDTVWTQITSRVRTSPIKSLLHIHVLRSNLENIIGQHAPGSFWQSGPRPVPRERSPPPPPDHPPPQWRETREPGTPHLSLCISFNPAAELPGVLQRVSVVESQWKINIYLKKLNLQLENTHSPRGFVPQEDMMHPPDYPDLQHSAEVAPEHGDIQRNTVSGLICFHTQINITLNLWIICLTIIMLYDHLHLFLGHFEPCYKWCGDLCEESVRCSEQSFTARGQEQE